MKLPLPAIAPRNLRHLRPWRQRLLDDPRLVILRPASPPLQRAQNLDPHRPMTLELDLRSRASRNTTRQTRRRSSDAYFGRNARRDESLGTPHRHPNPPLRRLDQRLCRLHRWSDEASAEVAPRYFQRGLVFQEECVKKAPDLRGAFLLLPHDRARTCGSQC
jgi:hypothetical protein